MTAKKGTRIRVVPAEGSKVYFEFPRDSVRRLVAREIARIKAERNATGRTTGIRTLRHFESWLETQSSESPSPTVPDQYVGWFLAQGLLSTKRLFVSIYCPDCCETYPKQLIVRKRWSVSGRGVRGHRCGGASGSYYACPQGHSLYEISRRVS